MQLHRRNQHPIGILKNAIYDYFDTNYANKFDKFDDLSPIVSVKEVTFSMNRELFSGAAINSGRAFVVIKVKNPKNTLILKVFNS